LLRSRRYRRRTRRQTPSIGVAFAGVSGLDASNYYASASGQGIVLAQAGSHVQAWINIPSQAVSSANRVFLANQPASNQGWRFITTGTNAILNGLASNGASNVVTPNYTIQASDCGRPLHVCMAIRSNQLCLWVDGVLIGSTAITTYTGGTSRMYVGRRIFDSAAADGIQVLGVAGALYAPTDAEVLAARNAGLAAGDVVQIAGGTSPKVYSFAGLVTAPGTLVAALGGQDLTLTGSLTIATVPV